MLLVALAASLVLTQAPTVDSGFAPTGQLLSPAGRVLPLPGGRPVDMRMSIDGKLLFVKDLDRLRVIDIGTWTEIGSAASSGGASLWGLAVSDSGRVFFTDAKNSLIECRIDEGWRIGTQRTIHLPGLQSFPCGVQTAGTKAYVCLSVNNTLGMVDLLSGSLVKQIPVGVAPYGVAVCDDPNIAYVTNQGGRAPKRRDASAPSAGTPTRTDRRGVAASGTVSVVDLTKGIEITQIPVGLQPSEILAMPKGHMLVCANANSDTISFIDSRTNTLKANLRIEPDKSLPYGSMPDALAITPDYKTLFVALAGDNSVAVIRDPLGARRIQGFIPTGWYPTALQVGNGQLYIANNKGEGSRTPKLGNQSKWNSYDFRGSVEAVDLPSDEDLVAMSQTVLQCNHRAAALDAIHRQRGSQAAPVPVPKRLGDPSSIHHVVYVIRENRTYDQVFGDLKEGEGNPALCTFGESVTPNAHKLVREFALLDNYYCNGVLSADGHSWATEANVTPYLDRAFGGFNRSYTFGDDPITYSSTGFVWDRILDAGFSFRNFGEMDYAEPPPEHGLLKMLSIEAAHQPVKISHNIGIARLRKYSDPDFPGWNLAIPDQLRMDIFLAKLREYEKSGSFPNFAIVYLPQDHTGGEVKPDAYVADNDLALGRLIEGLSRSPFWKDMAVFVEEDDPQNGFDHVDGHRSPCLVVSPYTRGRGLDHHFYNQTSVIRTILDIFGLSPLNQRDAGSPLMDDCFRQMADLTPYVSVPNQVPLDGKAIASRADAPNKAKRLFAAVRRLPLEKGEVQTLREDDLLNRYIWYESKGYGTPYPREMVGAHPAMLRRRGLRSEPSHSDPE